MMLVGKSCVLVIIVSLIGLYCTNPTNPFDAPRKLTYSTNPATYTIGGAISANQPTIEGKAPFIFTVSPALPAGLTLDEATGYITGIPTDTVTQRKCIVTGSNSTGNTVCTLIVTVNPEKPKSISYTINPAIYSVGRPILDNLPTLTGGTPARFSVSPTLPAGLRFDSLTGYISGTPTIAVQELGYTVKAENVSGYITVTLILTITATPLTNQTPQWRHKTLIDTITTGQSLALSLADSCKDPEGKTVTFNLLLGGPATDSISTTNTYRYTPSLADSGNYIVRIVGTDDSLASDTLTIYIRVLQSDDDSTPPVIRRFDPATDSIISSSASRTIKIIAKDASGISGVTFALAGNTIVGVRSDDSVWTGTITGLLANTFGSILVTAKDNSLKQNQAQMAMHIKYDPTATDNTPPDITPVAGITADTIIRNGTISATFVITDNSGLDSLFWTVNNQFAGLLVLVSGQTNQYRFTDTLTEYDTNRIVIVAVDKSTAHNRGTRSFVVIYRTAPATVSAVNPANGALNAPNTGLSLIWRKSICADGRKPSYVIKYGVSETALLSGGEAVDTIFTPVASTIKGNAQYFWQVLSVAGTDTVVSPAIGTFSFVTVNTPPRATLQSPSSRATSIVTTPTLMYGATKGDGDAVAYTIWLGTSRNLSTANQLASGVTAEQYPVTAALANATKYYWRVIAIETQGYAHASDTTAIDSFYTVNRAPMWNVAVSRDTAYYRVLADLSKYCSDPDGNGLTFSFVSGINCSLTGNTLSYGADSQEVTVKAKDNFSVQPCSSTVIFRVNRFRNPQMKLVPGGTFAMSRQVTLSSFWMDSTEVTQADYFALLKVDPSGTLFAVAPENPVTWFDAALYCNARSKRDGFDTVYVYTGMSGTAGNGCSALNGLNIDYSKKGYRLPTEAQFEFACRAGSTTPYWWGIDTTGMNNYTVTISENGPWPSAVATKLPNGYGLYDMTGNVWEWCNDLAGDYFSVPETDPTGAVSGSMRTRRGGSVEPNNTEFWYLPFSSSSRSFQDPATSAYDGFRCVLKR